jgi:hypothetical protein
MELDATKIPPGCEHLIPLAEQWGIGDDYDREEAVSKAADADLHMLVDAIRSLPNEDLYDWLGGCVSHSASPSTEYIAFTCLTMAYDSARVELKQRQNGHRTTGGTVR